MIKAQGAQGNAVQPVCSSELSGTSRLAGTVLASPGSPMTFDQGSRSHGGRKDTEGSGIRLRAPFWTGSAAYRTDWPAKTQEYPEPGAIPAVSLAPGGGIATPLRNQFPA